MRGPKFELAVGKSVWRVDGEKFEIRGFVDQRIVLRSYSKTKKRWYYTVETRHAFDVGLYQPQRPIRVVSPW